MIIFYVFIGTEPWFWYETISWKILTDAGSNGKRTSTMDIDDFIYSLYSIQIEFILVTAVEIEKNKLLHLLLFF